MVFSPSHMGKMYRSQREPVNTTHSNPDKNASKGWMERIQLISIFLLIVIIAVAATLSLL